MRNILTFDIEEYFDQNYPGVNLADLEMKAGNLEEEIRILLALCDKFQAKATFFILGRVAEKYPFLVRSIKSYGHEIASHGYSHQLVYNFSPEEFRADLQKSIDILQQITGEKILGFRAPSWSVTEETEWVYPIMKELGLKYSASVFPIKTFLYGIANAPRFPYNKEEILEIPVSTVKILGKNIPFSGGVYFRFWPTWFIKKSIESVNKEGKSAILYLHPREIDKNSPRLKLPAKESLIHYFGVTRTLAKLEYILSRFQFNSIKSEYAVIQ